MAEIAPRQIRFRLIARLLPGQISTQWVQSGRKIVPEVEASIEQHWQKLLARPGIHLFDGPVARLEQSSVDQTSANPNLHLTFSPTTYRIVAGTHFSGDHLDDVHGSEILGNSCGVSSVLQTSDGQLLLGRRSSRLAYYPLRVHPFAGSIEVQNPLDVFENIRRELMEELSLQSTDIESILCNGIAEDRLLRHPELIFTTITHQTAEQVKATFNPEEHDTLWQIPATPDAVAQAILTDSSLTPIAIATLLLWTRDIAGQAWFEKYSVLFVV